MAARRPSRVAQVIQRLPLLVRAIKGSSRLGGLLVRAAIVARYLETHAVRKLQVGANVCALPGWLNTDLYPKTIGSVTLDATRPFPFPDSSFDCVFSEHQIEHIGYDDGLLMLRECYRILRPGGTIRIATPSLDKMIALSNDKRNELQDAYIQDRTRNLYPTAPSPTSCFAINGAFRYWGHQFVYDKATLRLTLEAAGFADVRFFEPGESDDENLSGLETRVSEMDVYETMVVQGIRKTL
jgi:predicted SAM-dependent methyltransferase